MRADSSVTVLAGRYELLERIGAGGMSVVWRAFDRRLERDVAVKQLRSFVAEDPEQARRFRREARALAALAHEHIVRLFDYVASDEESFLVMEYVDGGNLAQATRGRLPLPAAAAVAYVRPVAQALAYAHSRGVVHRDLTPSNILVERDGGRIVTTDFGLARIVASPGSLTATGVLLGTPEYWSPELALGRQSGASADLYALGCILFLLLSGRLPFEGDDRLAVGLRRAHEDAPSLRTVSAGAPDKLVNLVDSLLERHPDGRPAASATAAALGALADALNAHQTTAVNGTDSSVHAIEFSSQTTAIFPASPPTVVLARDADAPEQVPSFRRRARRRVLAAVAASAAVIIAALLLAEGLRESLPRVPNVVALRESVARAQILRSLPAATVTVRRIYSTRVAAGHVIRQRPLPRSAVGSRSRVRLVVSKGTPFAVVPELAGLSAAGARASLARSGFAGRFAYEPSWTVRKGSVITLEPGSGTRLRRPARVTIVVASGYPRSVVPDIRSSDVSAAETQLAADHLRFRLVYRLDQSVPPGQVLDEIPAAGTSVYQGTQIRLTVARGPHWVKLFAASGTAQYQSNSFTVPSRWRIRYQLTANDRGFAFARVSWFAGGDFFSSGGFLADKPGSLFSYLPSDGGGQYRLALSPYAGTRWYVEVDALK